MGARVLTTDRKAEGSNGGDYRLLEHTADMGIEAFGASQAALFAAAAEGLMAIIGCRACPPGHQQRRLEVRADDRGELLVNWLGEILFLFEGGFVPATFAIERISATALAAQVCGEPYDPKRHDCAREVKAITYHRLLVEGHNRSWRGRVFVDL